MSEQKNRFTPSVAHGSDFEENFKATKQVIAAGADPTLIHIDDAYQI